MRGSRDAHRRLPGGSAEAPETLRLPGGAQKVPARLPDSESGAGRILPGSQEVPRRPQGGSCEAHPLTFFLGGSQEAPRSLPGASEAQPPGSSWEAPEPPGGSQEAPGRPLGGPQEPPGRLLGCSLQADCAQVGDGGLFSAPAVAESIFPQRLGNAISNFFPAVPGENT